MLESNLAAFGKSKIRPENQERVRWYSNRMLANKRQYQEIATAVGGGTPWWVVSILHGLESTFNFNAHMHNGDSLKRRTVRVPDGYPKHPPRNGIAYTFTESAIDALKTIKSFHKKDWTSIGPILDTIELYNGPGYKLGPRPYPGANWRYPPMRSPYLFSFTNQYSKGKYVRDGVFSLDAKSQQCGAVATILDLIELGEIDLKHTGGAEMKKPSWVEFMRDKDNNPRVYGMDGGTPVTMHANNNLKELIAFLEEQNKTAGTFLVAGNEKPAYDFDGSMPAPQPTGNAREAVLKVANEWASQGRRQAGSNWIDVNVLDPYRPAMVKLGQLGASQQDTFYNWCAAWVTSVLVKAGCDFKLDNWQPVIRGRKYWATIALVDTYRAWAREVGAYKAPNQAKPGDIVIYNWDDDAYTDHIGIVKSYAGGSQLVACEGNKSNREYVGPRWLSDVDGIIDLDKFLASNQISFG